LIFFVRGPQEVRGYHQAAALFGCDQSAGAGWRKNSRAANFAA
jgi:hypothetical protein